MNSNTDMMSEAQTRAMMAVLGKAENEFAASITAPLCRVVREADGSCSACNGSAFFLRRTVG